MRRALAALTEQMRGIHAAHLSAYGITPEWGVPTRLTDGIHVAAVNEDELAVLRSLQLSPTGEVKTSRFASPERVALFQAADQLEELHRADRTVPNGLLPTEAARTLDFGAVIAVEAGFAIGHVMLFDSRGTVGELYDLSRVPCFDTVANVWVAHRHRRRGVAAALLARARAIYPIVELQRPFSPAGEAWCRACAPDLLRVGRNTRCPCGSGKKLKRCHGERRAAA
jgi:hypothetical protein